MMQFKEIRDVLLSEGFAQCDFCGGNHSFTKGEAFITVSPSTHQITGGKDESSEDFRAFTPKSGNGLRRAILKRLEGK